MTEKCGGCGKRKAVYCLNCSTEFDEIPREYLGKKLRLLKNAKALRCKICKNRYLKADVVCGQCYYKKLRKANEEKWVLREEVAVLKQKLREKK